MSGQRRLVRAAIATGVFVALAARIVVAQSVNDFKNAADNKDAIDLVDKGIYKCDRM